MPETAKTKIAKKQSIIPLDIVESKILLIRGQKVMLDSDLAMLYEVETKILVRSVKRNIDRFPKDFIFQLCKEEFDALRFHFGTSKRGGRQYLPYVFTEQGIAMLSGILRSPKAIMVNIAIMRTFVKIRQFMATYEGLAMKIAKIEKKYDKKILEIFKVLDYLTKTENNNNKKEIGFKVV